MGAVSNDELWTYVVILVTALVCGVLVQIVVEHWE